MGKIFKWANTIAKMERTFGIDITKIHLLGIADDYWRGGAAVKVTELINIYDGASRATTHKAIKELVESGLLHMVDSEDDRRVRFLHPGKKLALLEKML